MGVVDGGPGARLLGCTWRLDTFGTVAPLEISIILAARSEGHVEDEQHAFHAAEVGVSPWMQHCHGRGYLARDRELLVDEIRRSGTPTLFTM